MPWLVSDCSFDPAAAATRVSYPSGDTRSQGTVVGVATVTDEQGDRRLAVVLDATAAHPLSPTWPDQPADHGVLDTAAGAFPLLDVRQGVLHEGGLTVDTATPRTPGVDVVVHLVDATALLAVGDHVEVRIEATRRRALSLAHTACHLSALAVDAALASSWTKPATPDPLGNPAFDQIAIASSTLHPYRSVDVYRLGKSLRKKGFDGTRLVAELDAVAAAHADTLARWVGQDAAAHVTTGDGTLAARRSWCCTLDGTGVALPCGGTHVPSTGQLAGITVAHVLSDAADQLTVTATVPGG